MIIFTSRKKDDEYARSINAFMNEQAKEEQIGFIDKALGWFGGSKAREDEDPSSSSGAFAVQPRGRAKRPYAHLVGEVVQEKGKPFTKSKDSSMPHARIYQGGDPNKTRQREARLIGA